MVKQHERWSAVVRVSVGHKDVGDFRKIHAMVRARRGDAWTWVDKNDVIDECATVDPNDAPLALVFA
jgi:hypothetical protein